MKKIEKIILNVAEKPSVAKAISKILSGDSYNQGISKSTYNPVQQFDYCFRDEGNIPVKMIMTSVSGHLMKYEFSEELKKWSVDIAEQLYKNEPFKIINSDGGFNNNKDIAENLKFHGRNIDSVILWLDCDREGENIAYEVLQIINEVKRNFKVYRAHFSSLADRDIKNAMENLRDPNQNLSQAVDVRQKIDLLTGYSFTVFQAEYFGNILKKFFTSYINQEKANMVLSYGLCQFPTLNFVVSRCDEIINFKCYPFYYIELIISKFENDQFLDVVFDWEYERLYDMSPVIVFNSIIEEEGKGVVTSVKRKATSRYRPVPLNTVNFQKLVSSKLKITSEEAMKIAEDLYRKGFISYPRTETQIFSKNENLRRLVEEQTKSSQWGEFALKLLNGSNERYKGPRNGKQDDKSHPPIHPVKHVNPSELDNKSFRIYEFICKYFLACVSCDAKADETNVEFTIGNQVFHTKGVIITDAGYLEVYNFDKWNSKYLPEFKEGEVIVPKSSLIKEGQTSPPNFLTEKELITLMDKNGIGTDATISEHIEKIVKRGYVYRDRGCFKPSLVGYALIHAYKHVGIELYKPAIRSNMEQKLVKICEGSEDPNNIYFEIKKKMESVFLALKIKSKEMQTFLEKFTIENKDFEMRVNNALKKERSSYFKDNEDGGDNNNKGDYDGGDNKGNYKKGNYGGENNKKGYENKNDWNNKNNSDWKNKGNYNNNNNNNNDWKNKSNYNNNDWKNKSNNNEGIKSYNNNNNNNNFKNNNNYNNQNQEDKVQPKNNTNYNISKGQRIYGNCRKCGSEMKPFKNRTNLTYFLGCSNYQQCKLGALSIRNPKELIPLETNCSKCKTQLFQMTIAIKPIQICFNCFSSSNQGIDDYLNINQENLSKQNKNNTYKNKNDSDSEDKQVKKKGCLVCGKVRHAKNDDCPGKKKKKKNDEEEDDFFN